MSSNYKRAEIIASGLVQGVGFRYYVMRHAQRIGLNGFVKNLYSGEVQTIVEGELALIEELFQLIKVGPSHSDVRKAIIDWSEFKNEFKTFEVRY